MIRSFTPATSTAAGGPPHPDLSLALATRFLEIAAESIEKGGNFTFSISGGSLPMLLGQGITAVINSSSSLSSSVYALEHMDKWHIFYADERCVVHSHADSNHNLVVTHLLPALASFKSSSSPHVYAIDESLVGDAAAAAVEYQQRMDRVLSPTNASAASSTPTMAVPSLDLTLLGKKLEGT